MVEVSFKFTCLFYAKYEPEKPYLCPILCLVLGLIVTYNLRLAKSRVRTIRYSFIQVLQKISEKMKPQSLYRYVICFNENLQRLILRHRDQYSTVENGYMHNGYMHKTDICTYFKSLESTKSSKKKRIYAQNGYMHIFWLPGRCAYIRSRL